jgi:hypothetical protein
MNFEPVLLSTITYPESAMTLKATSLVYAQLATHLLSLEP